LNGAAVTSGQAGSYVTVKNIWKKGDVVAFTLPFAWKQTQYEGVEQVEGYDRYAFEYGPLLMAIKGNLDTHNQIIIKSAPSSLTSHRKTSGQPLHFDVEGQPGLEVVPYLEIKPGMTFTCFPLFARKA